MTKQPEPPTKMVLTWEWVDRAAAAMTRHFLAKGRPFDAIVAVTRGGMPLACMLAQGLNIRAIYTVSVITKHSDPSLEHPVVCLAGIPLFALDSDKVLVVDDICDTGDTFRLLKQHMPKAWFTAPISKPQGLDAVDTYLTTIDQDIWVEFPWELESGWTKKTFKYPQPTPNNEYPN